MTPSKRYPELDALRGIAALLVVFFHFIWGRPDSGLHFNVGNMGVELFFIISGFVIFMSLSKAKTGAEFVINRFTRLYPTYWASLIITFILINIYYHYTIIDFPKLYLKDFVINLTMFQFYFGIPNIDESYWTLTIELLFYIFMFTLYKLKVLKHIQLIGLIISSLVVILSQFFWTFSIQTLFKWIPLLSYFPLFLSGIVFFKIFQSEKLNLKNTLYILVCFTSQFLLFKTTGRDIFFDAEIYLIVLICFMLIFFAASTRHLAFIAIKPLVFIGKISFALYLIHTFISINLLFPFLLDTLHLNYWLSALLIVLPVLILIATIITFLIEIPMQKLLKQTLKNRFLEQS